MDNVIKGLGSEVLMDAAFERVKAEMAALKPEVLQPISLDISAAVATVLGVLPEVNALRDRIVKELPAFDLARFDKLEDYALALNFAHARYLSATQPPDDLDAVSEQATKARGRLLAEAKALVLDGVLSDAQLAQLKGANGYKNVATDIGVLSNLLHEVWPQIQGKTRLGEPDLEEGLRLSARLLRIVGLREQGPAQVAEATSQRQRTFTLLMVAYDDARRAIAFLRADDGDADDIAPPLHPGRPRSKKSDATSQTAATATTAGASPTVTASTSGGTPTASGVAGAGSGGASGATTNAVAGPAAAGAPGGPFLR